MAVRCQFLMFLAFRVLQIFCQILGLHFWLMWISPAPPQEIVNIRQELLDNNLN